MLDPYNLLHFTHFIYQYHFSSAKPAFSATVKRDLGTVLIDPPITERWRVRGGEKTEVAWGLSFWEGICKCEGWGWELVFIYGYPQSFNLKLGVRDLLKLSKERRDQKGGAWGMFRQGLSPCQGKVSEGKSLQPWQSPWCAFIFVYLCVSIWISVCILAWLCVYTMNVCLSQMSGSCNEVGSQSLLFKLPLMSPGWREVLELIKFAWEPKSWQRPHTCAPHL